MLGNTSGDRVRAETIGTGDSAECKQFLLVLVPLLYDC